MNGSDIAQQRGGIAQNYFYDQPRRDDDPTTATQPVPQPLAPPTQQQQQQQPQQQQPPFAAGYDAHQPEPTPNNADNSAEDSGTLLPPSFDIPWPSVLAA